MKISWHEVVKWWWPSKINLSIWMAFLLCSFVKCNTILTSIVSMHSSYLLSMVFTSRSKNWFVQSINGTPFQNRSCSIWCWCLNKTKTLYLCLSILYKKKVHFEVQLSSLKSKMSFQRCQNCFCSLSVSRYTGGAFKNLYLNYKWFMYFFWK